MRESPWKDLPREVRHWLRRNPEYDAEQLLAPRDPVTGESTGFDRMEPEEAGRVGPSRGRRHVASLEDVARGHALPPEDVEEVLGRLAAGPPWEEGDQPSAKQQLFLRVWRYRIEYLMDFLPRHYRDLIEDYYFLGLSTAEMARLRGVAGGGSIRRTLNRAVQELRRLLVEHAADLAYVPVEVL